MSSSASGTKAPWGKSWRTSCRKLVWNLILGVEEGSGRLLAGEKCYHISLPLRGRSLPGMGLPLPCTSLAGLARALPFLPLAGPSGVCAFNETVWL